MATSTRTESRTIGAEVDIIGGLSFDRIYLRFAFAVVPSNYVYEDDGVTHKLNAAGQWDVRPTGVGGYTLWPSLRKMFQMEQAALAAVRADAAMTWDTAQINEIEVLKTATESKWDQMVADYQTAKAAWDAADPETRGEEPARPTVEALAAAMDLTRIDGDHPFRLDS